MEEKILKFLQTNNVCATWRIRKLLLPEVSNYRIRKTLRSMQAAGKVKLHRYSTKNNLVWALP